MSTERERLKANIMAQVDLLVEQALAQGETRLNLTQIEELTLAARRGIEQELTSGLLQQQVQHATTELATCPDCGRRLHPKGQKPRYLRTRSGAVTLHRPYFTPTLLLLCPLPQGTFSPSMSSYNCSTTASVRGWHATPSG